ncbi:hypothetical protein JTB14_019934 [Gonioctena quinquepunctata]|nr:hypothetical protein JTB14_019934 [Gonioctena quinquepunctata]
MSDCFVVRTASRFFIILFIKIARESLNIDKEQSQAPEGNQEWKRFVGSIRRKVQRHVPGSSESHPATSQSKSEPLSRKNSLTHNSRFEMFKREKSCDKDKKSDKQPLTKQKSIGPEPSSKTDLFKALSFREKSKSVSAKQVETMVAPKAACDQTQKSVRKSDKKDSEKGLRTSISFCRSKGRGVRNKEGLKQDDFLKATMRIFLVVSPPVGRIQARKGPKWDMFGTVEEVKQNSLKLVKDITLRPGIFTSS